MSIDHYPSTHDVWVQGEDPLYGCLLTGRTRVAVSHTTDAYVGSDGEVCAIGGALVAVGITSRDSLGFGTGDQAGFHRTLEKYLNEHLVVVVKEAIALLDEVALERHPEMPEDCGGWLGPLEWVNQTWDSAIRISCDCNEDDCEDTELDAKGAEILKDEILAIYDEAISRRAAQLEPERERELVLT